MNTALLAAIMRRKREVADRNAQNAERDARAAQRDNLRRMENPMYRNQLRIERHDAEVAQAAALIARTTIDAGSIPEVPSIRAPPRPIAEYKNGGLVKKTGLAKVHKGEIVIPANRVAAVKKAVKKAGLKTLKT